MHRCILVLLYENPSVCPCVLLPFTPSVRKFFSTFCSICPHKLPKHHNMIWKKKYIYIARVNHVIYRLLTLKNSDFRGLKRTWDGRTDGWTDGHFCRLLDHFGTHLWALFGFFFWLSRAMACFELKAKNTCRRRFTLLTSACATFNARAPALLIQWTFFKHA